MSLTIKVFRGEAVAAVVDDLARLRITVFRDWPYLYEGNLDYERNYLHGYCQSDAIVVGAFEGSRMVGASTGMPLLAHSDDFGAAFEGTDLDLREVFYCAESVLLAECRGQGVGHRFFDEREAHARSLGAKHSAFCRVVRPDDHPLQPPDYRPLDPFWRSRGYAPLAGAVATFRWTDIGESEETEKSLQYWIRGL